MKLDPTKYYRMPLVMGPAFDLQDPPKVKYPHTEVLAFQYETDESALRALLPECYQPADEPIATILFAHNSGVEFLAGGDYGLAAVQVAARFEGERDQVEGDYIVVMFENSVPAIIGGREDLGVPKVYGDISPMKLMGDGKLRCEVSLWGHLLFGIETGPFKATNWLVRAAASRMINARPWLGYKYIPSLEGPPDAAYPVLSKNDVKVDELFRGESARLYFGTCDGDDVGLISSIVDAIKALPVRRIGQVFRLRGSVVLRYDTSHRLL